LFGAETKHQKVKHEFCYITLMVSAALFNALNVHFIHGLSKKVHPSVNMFYSNVGSLAINTVILLFLTTNSSELLPLDLKFWVVMPLMSLFSLLTRNFIFLANSILKPSLMMPFGYVAISISFIADVYLYDTQFTLTAMLGMCLTAGGLLSGYLT
jgi:drug/metabolite transporter (DMT)-like permease